MFTGIIQGIGTVQKIENHKNYSRLWIKSSFSLKGAKLGDSMAVDGCCLTYTSLKGRLFSADLSPETLDKTRFAQIQAGEEVNLERPLRLGEELGGHLVQGHVDALGEIKSKKLFRAKPQSYYLVEIKVPRSLMTYMIPKGSVAVDGISLTINEIKSNKIKLCIIPHTQSKTTLTGKKAGDKVHLEADMMLKFLEKIFKNKAKKSL
ncbi:MAG: riboflavin synthase [Deltaproteobacteria bacterium]|nr:riboflavin synthase [Deltaproteobacteria bacterium]